MREYFSLIDCRLTRESNRLLRLSRILKSTEFNEVFSLASCLYTKNFVCYYRPSEVAARIGCVIGKKQAKRAVTRNTLKRLIRETFRRQQEKLFGYDIIIRLRNKVPTRLFVSATSCQFKIIYGAEIQELFDRFIGRL